MTTECILSCPYHGQDGAVLCGPACAMMALGSLGIPPNGLSQSDLYDKIQPLKQDSSWWSDPYGLSQILNQILRHHEGGTYAFHSLESIESLTLHILETLINTKRPCLIPIYSTRHWSVIYGATLDAPPSQPGSYSVDGFWLNIPVETSATQHGPGDDCERSADHQFFVPFSEFYSSYIQEYACKATEYLMRYIVLSSDRTPTLPAPRMPKALFPRTRPPGLPVSLPQILKRARQVLAQRSWPWQQPASLQPVRLRRPLVVERLDQAGVFYALVPVACDGQVRALLVQDAHDGTLLGHHPLPTPRRQLFPSLARVLAGALPSLQGPLSEALTGDAAQAAALVWKPCPQSWSPTLPFWHIHTPQGPLYLRVDGRVFSALTSERSG